jgi:hypothetical protein
VPSRMLNAITQESLDAQPSPIKDKTPFTSVALPSLTWLPLPFYVVLGFELRVFTLSHSTSPFL